MIERSGLIEDYLDQLLVALRGTPGDIRRMLAETEQHLYEAADAGVARGLIAEQAAREAINRFGPVARVAGDWNASAPEQPGAVGGSRRQVVVGRLRRRRGVIIAGGLLGMVAGLTAALLARPEPRYSSTTMVSVSGIPDATTLIGGRTNSSVNMDNERELLESAAVISRAKVLLGVDTDPAVLAQQVSATVPANTWFMAITFVAGTPTKAQQGSEAFAKAYELQRKADVDGLIEVQKETLNTELNADAKLLATYASQAATLPPTNPQQKTAESYVQIYQDRIRDTKQQLANLTALDVSPVTRKSDPSLPTAPFNPPPSLLVYLIAGLCTGLLTTALLAAVMPTRPTEAPPALSTA